ncbi:helix-turn-helix transcriptional regulator, partial [Acinetobacter baumannii]
MTIGDRITERLATLGLSQSELARRVGMAQSSVNSLINRNKVGSKH